jgi:hypothetical protein
MSAVLNKPSTTNPLTTLVKKFKDAVAPSLRTTIYLARNEEKVVKPFLASIRASYIQIEQAVIVHNHDDTMVATLCSLGFQRSGHILPVSGTIDKIMQMTQSISLCRWYHAEFNIELHLVTKDEWLLVQTAHHVCHSLSSYQVKDTVLFMKVYDSLQSFSPK